MSSAGHAAWGWLGRLKPDLYIVAILSMVIVASIVPVRGEAAKAFSVVTSFVIALVFFLHGARLSREAVIAGITHWRLHITVLGATFLLFPLLGLANRLLPHAIQPPSLAAGVLFLCCLPSTVQSSIAFTAVARGNVAAAVCAASASNLIGIFLTPLLASLFLNAQGAGLSWDAFRSVVLQLLAPFLAGQVARRWIVGWITRHAKLTGRVDRGSILFVVYSAFSAAVVQGIWTQVSVVHIAWLAVICTALLAMVLAITVYSARTLGFSKPDEITIAFCGSKKSLATGVPLATILFPPASVGLILLPVMLFHQIQLMVCAVIAQRYAARAEAEAPA